MRTIGEVLKLARQKKKYSLEKLEEITKIKRIFLQAIEDENWEALPDFPVVFGFVRTFSERVGLETQTAAALLRRDYPPKKIRISPKPDIENKFRWSPRTTFLVGVVAFVLLVGGYLGVEYLNFRKPPKLVIQKPEGEKVIFAKEIVVSGVTDSDATITVNNQPILVDGDGKFSDEVPINSETQVLVIKAVSRSGKETIVSRSIINESN